MTTAKFTVTRTVPLQSREAALFTDCANGYVSRIALRDAVRQANAKSLLGVLAMGVQCGMELELSAEGEDEQEAVQALKRHLA